MRKDIHPEYREVLFHDTSVDTYFLIPSSLETDQTKEWEGKTYPYFQLDVSSASHPFYTGKQNLVDTAGRVDKFRKRFGNKTKVNAVSEDATEETPVENSIVEETATDEVPTEEPAAEETTSEEGIVEEASTEEEPSQEPSK
jgi:large subunit ribosomal protein L31